MSHKRYDDELLLRLRNDIPVDWLIKHLGWPAKMHSGSFVFVCPCCQERGATGLPRFEISVYAAMLQGSDSSSSRYG